MLRIVIKSTLKFFNNSSRMWGTGSSVKRSQNVSRTIPSIGLGRQTTKTVFQSPGTYYHPSVSITGHVPVLPHVCFNHPARITVSDLRAKLLVACLVTPGLWLNLSNSRKIWIIHFGLLLKERTLDSSNLLVMDDTLYLFVSQHIYTVDSC